MPPGHTWSEIRIIFVQLTPDCSARGYHAPRQDEPASIANGMQSPLSWQYRGKTLFMYVVLRTYPTGVPPL